jgi:hypothetical protein
MDLHILLPNHMPGITAVQTCCANNYNTG